MFKLRVLVVAAMLLGALSAQAVWANDATATLSLPGQKPVIVHGPLAAAQAILDAERAFDARSRAAGPAIAMREFMDPVDGLSFAGGEPARGADAIFRAHGGNKPAGTLTWVPAEIFATDHGDMGASWGHFRYAPPSGAPGVTGKYVTVWRNIGGKWRGVIDIGNPD